MSRNKAEPTERYREAVRMLRSLLATEGLDSVECAYAEAVADATKGLYAEKNDAVVSPDRHVCTMRLKGRKCPDQIESPCNWQVIPGQDHLSEWKREGETRSIVFEPYSLTHDTLKKLIDYCEREGFELRIGAESWYFRGRCLQVELIRQG